MDLLAPHTGVSTTTPSIPPTAMSSYQLPSSYTLPPPVTNGVYKCYKPGCPGSTTHAPDKTFRCPICRRINCVNCGVREKKIMQAKLHWNVKLIKPNQTKPTKRLSHYRLSTGDCSAAPTNARIVEPSLSNQLQWPVPLPRPRSKEFIWEICSSRKDFQSSAQLCTSISLQSHGMETSCGMCCRAQMESSNSLALKVSFTIFLKQYDCLGLAEKK